MYDVIIIGARCAGSPLAMLLARHGAKVLLVDRAVFPSDIPHGHFIHREGPKRLQRWGLLDKVAEVSPGITTQLIDLGDFPLITRNLQVDGVAWGYGPRRHLLDKILVDAAVQSGVEVREGFHVNDFLFDGNKVAGIRGRAANNAAIEERATITVGADGRNSFLARSVRAPSYDYAPAVLAYYFSYWSGVKAELFELYHRTAERRVIFSFRTSNDLYGVFVGLPVEELDAVKSDIESAFMRSLDLVPDFAQRVREGKREERFFGATDLPNFYRKPYGPGWALAGDAGCHKDPYMALGVSDAFRDAEFLAEALGSMLGSGTPMDEALAVYERRRNEFSIAEYRQNLSAARFDPLPPEVLRIRQAVRERPEEATRFAMARFGVIDRSEFFNPANLQRLLGGQARA